MVDTNAPPPMVVRLDFAEYEDDDGYTHVNGWTFAPPEEMTREAIAEMLLDKGFKRIDNYQDQDDALDGAG